jgi:hypothetical protein
MQWHRNSVIPECSGTVIPGTVIPGTVIPVIHRSYRNSPQLS